MVPYQNPGDLVYVPEGWYHATHNLDNTIVSYTMSRFLYSFPLDDTMMCKEYAEKNAHFTPFLVQGDVSLNSDWDSTIERCICMNGAGYRRATLEKRPGYRRREGFHTVTI